MATFSVFGATAPVLTDLNDSDSYALGVVVEITGPGTITHARRYGSTTPPSGPVTWRVSDLLTGDLIKSHVFAGSGPGWIEEPLVPPVDIPAAQNVILWIGTPDRYVATTNYFTSGDGAAGITSGPLTAPASGDDPAGVGNGRFGGDPDSVPGGTISGGNYFVDMLFETPPPQGVADFPINLVLAGTGQAPAITPNEGAAAIGIGLAVATTGDAPAIDPSEGAAAIGMGLALAATGDAPEVLPNQGVAAFGLNLAVAATGDAPAIDPNQGAAALGLNLTMAGTGFAPDPGDASGTATFTLGLALAASGAQPSANGQAAFSLNLALAGAGDNDAPFTCRPVRSFSEVMPS